MAPPEPGSLDSRLGGLGLVMAPMVFVVGWNVGGLLTVEYSPVHEAISEIAGIGAEQRTIMTAAFVGYGLWLLIAVPAVRRSLVSPIWPALVVNAVATLAVAALPLHRSHAVDVSHGIAATVGYVSLAAVPILAIRPLKAAGFSTSVVASILAAVGIGVFLALTVVLDAKGFAQRAGLAIGDLWLACTGFAIVTGRLDVPRADAEGHDPEPDRADEMDQPVESDGVSEDLPA